MSENDPFAPVLKAATAIWEALGEWQAPEDTAGALRSLRAAIVGLKLLDDDLADRLADVVSHGDTQLDTIRVTKRTGKARKAWDHEKLIARVVACGRDERLIDRETGEALESEAAAVVRALVECAGIRDWRVTALKARGIDPDDYAEVSPGRVTVVVT